MKTNNNNRLAVVLSGGGARAAYQVGFLRYIARVFPEIKISILTGVSSGAINAAFLANHPGNFTDAVWDLCEVWRHLTIDQVYRVDNPSLIKKVIKWLFRLGSGGIPKESPERGLVDTAPLKILLQDCLDPVDGMLTGIQENIRRGQIEACAITGTSYATGQAITWVQGDDIKMWQRPFRKSVKTPIRIEHIMASAALPIFFPAVQVGKKWFGDGGIRQTAPLSPAIYMGARKIMVISTRYRRSFAEAEIPMIHCYPPPAQIIGILMNAIFLDLLDQDARTLENINQLIPETEQSNHPGSRRVELFVLRPSQDLGTLAGEFEPDLPFMLRWLTRSLGTRETKSPDWLSMIMFEPHYLKRLLEIGEADAENRRDDIAALLA